jgi:cytochrome c-type biogenesis protein CcmH
MMVFWLAAAALTALAVLMLRPAAPRARVTGATTLDILQQQLAQLDAERAAGHLDPAQHAAARLETQRRLLDESPAGAAALPGAAHPGSLRSAWLLSGAIVALVACASYAALGNRAALEAPPPQQVTNADVEQMVNGLASRLEADATLAQDAGAWQMLARSYAAMQRFGDAAKAYARATALLPNDAQLLADHADVLAMEQGGRAAGEPARLIRRALEIDPNNLKALALAGSEAFERNDMAGAIRHWQAARQRAVDGSEFAAGLDRSLAEARTTGGAVAVGAGGGTTTAGGAAAGAGGAAATDGGAVAVTGARITGRITLAPALAARVQPGDTLFITARAIEGPRMPLAVLKRTAADLPLEFTLDDSLAMSPELTLSKFPKVVVTARISRSGNAMPQPGDLSGQAPADAAGGARVQIGIDTVRP